MSDQPVPQFGAQSPVKEKSSASKWLLIGGIGCALVLILGIGGCVGVVYFALGKAKDSAIYKEALAQVQKNPQAVSALGEPIEGGMPSSFNFNANNNITTATLVFAVSGPKGGGVVTATGTSTGGPYNFSVLTMQTGATVIDVLGGATPNTNATVLPNSQPAAPPAPADEDAPAEQPNE